jgi:hypothetical protein
VSTLTNYGIPFVSEHLEEDLCHPIPSGKRVSRKRAEILENFAELFGDS